MKRSKALALVVLGVGLLVGSSGCDSFSEVRENPNVPTVVPEDLQLPALLSNFSYEVVAHVPRTTTSWMQQTAWNGVPPSADNYDVKDVDVNNLWTFFSYTDVMYDAVVLDSTATQNGNFAYAAIAKTILAWNLSIVTDLWNAVPYSEAFDPSNTTPAYDTQEEIYAAVFGLLNDALADYDKESILTPAADDLLYGGDMAKWERLTYTLLARFHMRLTEAPENSATERATQALAALNSGFQSNADNADFAYFAETGSENPWYQFAIDSKWDTRNQLSAHYINLLKARKDPRLFVQVRQAGAVDGLGVVDTFQPEPVTAEDFALSDSTYVGHENGEDGIGTENISSFGTFYSAPGASLNWLNYAEALFLKAEATLILQGAAAADPIYRDAIRASMEQLGVPEDVADEYIASRPPLSSVNALEALITEKYIANFLHAEVYNDWRRAGYPELEPVTNQPRTPSGIIPLRYPYPSSELNNNAAVVEQTGVPQGYRALEVPVWWDTTN